MAKPDELVTHILDALASYCPVEAKAMFGGFGVYCDGLMFAIIVKGDLYVKVDDESRNEFEERGLQKFSYLRQGKPQSMSYYSVPEEVFDDSDALHYWAGMGYEAALRAKK